LWRGDSDLKGKGKPVTPQSRPRAMGSNDSGGGRWLSGAWQPGKIMKGKGHQGNRKIVVEDRRRIEGARSVSGLWEGFRGGGGRSKDNQAGYKKWTAYAGVLELGVRWWGSLQLNFHNRERISDGFVEWGRGHAFFKIKNSK